MNRVILMGRLTRDPELSQTPSGVSVTRFTIAVDRRYSGKDGQRQTDFISCTAWRQTGEFISRYFRKGSMIAVEGSIQTRTWDDRDGKRQYATDVVIDQAYFTGSRAETGTAGAQGFSGGGYSQSGGFGSQPQGGYSQSDAGAYTRRAPSFAEQPPSAGVDDFESLGFSSLDGSEDDMPF